MIDVTISVDTSKIDRTLADFPAMVAAVKTRALAYVGQAVASRATLAFRTASFRPSPWAPRKSGGKHPLLIKSGSLRQSIGWKFSGDDAVVVGTDRKYAGYHQFGTKRMPARPFMPFDRNGNLTPAMAGKIEREIRRIVADELK